MAVIGTVREIKTQEFRVGLVPSSVRELTARGHQVLVESGAGADINFTDERYQEAGAEIVPSADDVFARAELIVKVKEPQAIECKKLREGQVLFTYLHLAADPEQAKGLTESGSVAIAYETVTDDFGGLPLLAPMSEIAGRLSIQVGAFNLQKHQGGIGRLMSGVPGVSPAKTLILGGGVAGFNAAKMAVGLGSDVTILEKSQSRMRALDEHFGNKVKIIYSTREAIEERLTDVDLVIGAILIPGASAPRLITKADLEKMQPGSVMVDIAIDQGGCFETAKPTTHDKPTYVVDDVVHYCVANMPGAVPLTSALALNHAVLPHVIALADKGWKEALIQDPNLRRGLNVCAGKITHREVANSLDAALNLDFAEANACLGLAA